MRRKSWSFFPVIVICLGLYSPAVHAATVNAASCSASAVQTAINSATDGDTVIVSGGSCTWAGGAITISKAITLDGQGTTSITFSGNSTPALTVSVVSAGNTFVTGFTFTQQFTNGSYPIAFNTLAGSGKAVRFHHNTCNAGSPGNPSTMIGVQDNGIALIDHNTFTTTQGADETIHVLGSGSGWNDDVVPGGPNMIFIEDNTFAYNSSGTDYGSAIQSYYGARTVVRHNTFTALQIDQHGTCGGVWTRWWEIYDNNFLLTKNVSSIYAAIRGGSGVIWGNTVTNPQHQQGSGDIDLINDCGNSYPTLYQAGRGINQNLSPAYLWGNDSNMHISSTSSSIQLNRDYFESTSQPITINRCQSAADVSAGCFVPYNYVPYTYPHPLQGGGGGGGGGSAPAPPSGLAAIVH